MTSKKDKEAKYDKTNALLESLAVTLIKKLDTPKQKVRKKRVYTLRSPAMQEKAAKAAEKRRIKEERAAEVAEEERIEEEKRIQAKKKRAAKAAEKRRIKEGRVVRVYKREKALTEIPRYNNSYVRKKKEDEVYITPQLWHNTKSKCELKKANSVYNQNKPKKDHVIQPCLYTHTTREGIDFAQCGRCNQLFSISSFGASEKRDYTAIEWDGDELIG